VYSEPPRFHISDVQGATQRSRLVLKHLEQLVSAPVEQLLTTVVTEFPPLVGGRGCSIYLRPDLVPEYDGRLVNGSQESVSNESLGGTPFVVLAASSRPSMQNLIGRAYYCEGEGLTGWIYKHDKPLCVGDAADARSLRSIDKTLKWLDRYGGSAEYYGERRRKPFLGVPITGPNNQVIGVLKVPAAVRGRGFPPTALPYTSTVAQLVGTLLVQRLDYNKRTRSMLDLAGITALASEEVAQAELLRRFAALLPFGNCRLYLQEDHGQTIKLKLDSAGGVDTADAGAEFARDQGLVAWIVRTGKPLILTDMHEYAAQQWLDDTRLDNISNGAHIRDRDRFLQCVRADEIQARDAALPFLGVPVVRAPQRGERASREQQVVLGALTASALVQPADAQRVKPFSRAEDLEYATAFASAIAAVHWSARNQELSQLLIELGSLTATNALYRLTVDRLAQLLHGADCYVYELTKEQLLKLTHANLAPQVGEQPPNLPEIVYSLGEGKTGFVAQNHVALAVSYFGSDPLDQERMRDERERIAREYPHDLVRDVLDENSLPVGLAQVRDGARLQAKALSQLDTLAQASFRFGLEGMRSRKEGEYTVLRPHATWSLIMVPMLANGDLYGVLSLTRALRGVPFTAEDVDLVEKIAKRLGEAAHSVKLTSEREQTLAFYAHEFSTPVASMRYNLLGIQGRLAFEQADVRQIVQESLEQLDRMRMLSQSIILTASDATHERHFAGHSLRRLLQDACNMFRLEAQSKGIDIKEPFSRGGPFPEMDMARDELELAFKNLLHNAVKYSTVGTRQLGRYVQVTGEPCDRDRFRVSISNIGIGIDEADLDKVFLPYWRSKKARRLFKTGAGLGLRIAQRIVHDLHGGEITVTSEPLPSGAHLTVFSVTLPIRQSAKNGHF
jgi:signal transduction histidine kinase